MADPTIEWLSSNAHAMLNSIEDAVIAIDSHGYIQYANSAVSTMFGFALDELLQMPVGKLMPKPYGDEHQAYIERYLASRDPRILGVSRETVALAKDGRTFPIHLSVNEVMVDEESWFVGIARDMSVTGGSAWALLEQRERYARINRLSTLGAMMANIAHEINQPLAAIALYAQTSQQLLSRSDVDIERLTAALERLNAQALRAGEVVERIQNHVKAENSEKKLIDLNSVLTEVQPLVIADVKASSLELEFQLLSPSPKIYCNPIQIQQVVIDLVRNAADAMHEVNCRYGRVITILSRIPAPGFATVSVIDRGTGVPESEKSTLFEAFRSTKASGTGMGLPVSRSMIEQHDGTLECENNPDFGATFSFTLPDLSQVEHH